MGWDIMRWGEEGAQGQFYGNKDPSVRSRLGGEVVSLLTLEVRGDGAPQAQVGGQESGCVLRGSRAMEGARPGPVAPRLPEAVGCLVRACTSPAEGAWFSEESLKCR